MVQIAEIEKAHEILKGVALETPLMYNHELSTKYGAKIFLKREDMQVVRSFKIRGAYYKMQGMARERLDRGVVCASAGNHAQGFAFACSSLGVKGRIFMPTTTPSQKISKVRHFGGDFVEVVLEGDDFDQAFTAANAYSQNLDLDFIHPFNDLAIMAGQGTVGKEILDRADEPIDFLITSVGGGGLISGVGSYFKQKSPDTKIIAVEAEGAPALYNALKNGSRVTLDNIDTFADGIAVKSVGDLTFPICQEVVGEVLLVPEGKICATILELYNDQAIVAEPAAAIVVSVLDDLRDQIVGKTVVCILSGGNNDIARTEEIRERALLYQGRKHYFVIKFPQRAGALREFLNVLGPDDDISHFEYTKKNNKNTGPALVGIELKYSGDYDALIQRMNNANISFEHLNENQMIFDLLI